MSGHASSPCELDQMSKTKLVNMKMFLEQEHFFPPFAQDCYLYLWDKTACPHVVTDTSRSIQHRLNCCCLKAVGLVLLERTGHVLVNTSGSAIPSGTV